MTALIKQLSNYATYHRDPRNIATHFFGVPMIVLGVTAFLSRPAFDLAGFTASPAVFVALAAAVFYLRLDLRFGLAMSAILGTAVFVGSHLAAVSTLAWVGSAGGLFVIGWVIQFVGHYWEGRKPAFVDDLVGLLVGPLFVTAELGFLLGLRHDVKADIEKVAGPTRLNPNGAKSAATT